MPYPLAKFDEKYNGDVRERIQPVILELRPKNWHLEQPKMLLAKCWQRFEFGNPKNTPKQPFLPNQSNSIKRPKKIAFAIVRAFSAILTFS